MLQLLDVLTKIAVTDGPLEAAALLVAANHSALEDATLHGRLEDERARLLGITDKVRLLLTDWSPMTPQDYADVDALFSPRVEDEQGGEK